MVKQSNCSFRFTSAQFSAVVQSCLTLCNSLRLTWCDIQTLFSLSRLTSPPIYNPQGTQSGGLTDSLTLLSSGTVTSPMWGKMLPLTQPMEKEMATHSNILVWRIPWVARVRHNLDTKLPPRQPKGPRSLATSTSDSVCNWPKALSPSPRSCRQIGLGSFSPHYHPVSLPFYG